MNNTTPTMNIEEARRILGTTAKELSDSAIMHIVTQVGILTDVVVAHVNDSKNHTSVAIQKNILHTDG
jgi:hypothetical protein